MRKVHCKVVLDVFIVADDDMDIIEEVNTYNFMIDPFVGCSDNVDVQDIITESVEVTDSR